MTKWAGDVVCTREKKNTYRVLEGNASGKRQLSRPVRRWEDILGWM
jgi:hypothetical protein